MNDEIRYLVKLNTVRDIEIELMRARAQGKMILDEVFQIIEMVERSYLPQSDSQAISQEEKDWIQQDEIRSDLEHEQDLIDLQQHEEDNQN